MKILVPTDFSTSSRKAIKYAAFLAETLKAELILLHAVSDLSIWLEKEEQRTNRAAQAKLESLAQSIRKNYNERIKVSTFLVQQFPLNDVINNMALKMKIDFVVIGSKGVTGAANKLIGSFAAGMIRHCNVPVIAVPESNKKKNVSSIVLPTDLLNISDEINTVVSFAKKFNAVIHVLFVSGKKGGALPLNANKLTNYKNIQFHEISGKETEAVIEKFIIDKNADLLAMFTRKRKFFARLFHPSLTVSLSFDISIPLLSFKKE